jgi:hypothetical protein
MIRKLGIFILISPIVSRDQVSPIWLYLRCLTYRYTPERNVSR